MLQERTSRRLYGLGLAAVTLAAAVLRILRLDGPMRYDEAFTYLAYAQGGLRDCFVYSAPNNHVLHTLLVYVSTTFGGIGPTAVRAPALLAGVALVPVGAELARRLGGRRIAGLIAAGLIATSSILIEYSANGRGYTMLCLASVVLVILSRDLVRAPRRSELWGLWALVAAAGAWTIPVMLYPLGLCAAGMIAQAWLTRPDEREAKSMARGRFAARLGVALTATAVLTLLMYAPVLVVSGTGELFGNRFVAPKSMCVVLAELPAAAGEALSHWLRDTSILWWISIIAGLVAAGVEGVRQRRVWRLLPLWSPALLALAALAHRVVPFPRVWLFLLPILLAIAADGLAGLATRFRPRRAPWLAPAAVAALVLVATCHSAWRTHERAHLISEEPHTLVDAKTVVLDCLAMADGHTGFAFNPRVANWPPLAYYVTLYSSPERQFVNERSEACRRVLIVVDHRHTVAEALAQHPHIARKFGRPRLLKSYERASLYVVRRRG